jgi:CRISPR-associated endonuclease/helicase Cas3
MQLWAHSANSHGKRHGLEDHLRGTRERALRKAAKFGAEELAAYLALVHDVGKGTCAWQAGLRRAEGDNGPVGIPHKHAGTWLAAKAGLDVFSGVVFGHHGGLVSLPDLETALREADGDLSAAVREAIDSVGTVVPEIHHGPTLPAWLEPALGGDPLVAEVLLRMVFSTVVDADFLDTDEHATGMPRPEHPLAARDLADRYEQALAAALAKRPPTPIDGIRRRVYAHAVAAADGPQGFYRMAAPTGSGKTFAAAGFALHHARRHGLDRVIVAVPYTSITEQNAQEYHALLDRVGELPVVLEHHSAVDLDAGRDPRAKLAAENWDAPFVVTTTVRLFESLFDRRPSAVRRLHNIARSVIVLDEVQSLPDGLLVPILSMLRTLTEHFGVTVLLASATQPTLFDLPPLKQVRPRDVIADPGPLYVELSRVSYTWQCDPAPTLEEVAADAAACPSVLVICNTTAQAADLHRLVERERGAGSGPVLHLSTRMVARHRRDTIDVIRELTAVGAPVAVVSTQLVEAGVDLDFPVVYRAFATAEAMQQAAGRCNRAGRLAKGRVVVFDIAGPDGEPQTKGETVYGAAVGATRAHFGPDRAFPDDLDALDAYYRDRFTRTNVDKEGKDVQKARGRFDFPATARLFRMIDDLSVPVVAVPDRYEQEYGPRIRQVLGLLRSGVSSMDLMRELRPFTATIPKNMAFGDAAPFLSPVVGDLYEWLGDYSDTRGVEITDTQEYVF